MTSRECLALVILANYVLSAPVSPNHMEDNDVKVMRCIVEVLADTLSKLQPLPVSQDCLDTLSTDERLVSILRHRNFLKELQDIAMEGANERAHQTSEDVRDHMTDPAEGTEGTSDQTMLVPLATAGTLGTAPDRRSTTSSEERSEESQDSNDITRKDEEEEEESEEEGSPNNRISLNPDAEEVDSQAKTAEEKDEDEDLHDEDEEVAKLREEGPIDSTERHSEAEKSAEEGNEEVQQMRRGAGQDEEEQQHEEGEEKRGAEAKRWGSVRKLAHNHQAQSRMEEEEVAGRSMQEAPHHSKEEVQDEEAVRQSPEVQDLQLMVGREPEERREEEGSASRRAEDPEIESLAAIETELENVAQKLHELRRG